MLNICIFLFLFTLQETFVCCSVGKFKMLTERSRQTWAQFKKDKKATLSHNESQVHKYDKFVKFTFIYYLSMPIAAARVSDYRVFTSQL